MADDSEEEFDRRDIATEKELGISPCTVISSWPLPAPPEGVDTLKQPAAAAKRIGISRKVL